MSANTDTGGLGLDIELLEQSFAVLAPQGEQLVARFYEELFSRYPGVKPLFKNTDQKLQQKKLLASLVLVVNNLRNPDTLVAALTEMGKRHQGYGAVAEHYPAVTETLLAVMQELAGDAWTDKVHAAWSKALSTVASVMLEAYEDLEDGKMSADNSSEVIELRKELQKMQVAVDGAQTAMIMVDRDFIITYFNQKTKDILTQYRAEFAAVWPGFDPNKVMGACIDQFHKDPSHQRRLLSSPDNLPHKADISVGDLKFALTVSAQIDPSGNYIGNTLEWEDVTEQRNRETDVARLQSAVDGAQANLMICDQDLNITYANPAVIAMMANREAELREIWPGFDTRNLVGQCIDQFHKNPAHQRRLLSDINSLPAQAEIKVGSLEFSVNATAILDAEGNWMGNMVEWQDVTEQKSAERAIAGLIESAGRGELNERIDATQYQGFLKNLSTGINELLDSVVEPLQASTRVMQALAEGDLSQEMQGEFAGEFAVIRDAVNTCSGNLKNMVNQIRDSASTIGTSASEISRGNADLSQRTEEQASSLEETASSMEELTSTVKQNADNARQANQLASGARDQAEKGGEVVSRAVTAMSEINGSSKKIADIIGVIDEIAFQTNLLALNAAVEAARAGEQGRGFAVVASEVRNLAQRSAEAAKEIKTLINDSVEKVSEGTKLVDESGTTLSEIVNSVKKVSDIIAEITAASEEQATGIDQVNKAVMEMDKMTQENAALVEEATAAGESMDEQAQGLSELMEFFNVGDASLDQAMSTTSAERRATVVRPWTDKKAQTKTKSATPARNKPAPRKVAGGGADDGEWEEF